MWNYAKASIFMKEHGGPEAAMEFLKNVAIKADRRKRSPIIVGALIATGITGYCIRPVIDKAKQKYLEEQKAAEKIEEQMISELKNPTEEE